MNDVRKRSGAGVRAMLGSLARAIFAHDATAAMGVLLMVGARLQPAPTAAPQQAPPSPSATSASASEDWRAPIHVPNLRPQCETVISGRAAATSSLRKGDLHAESAPIAGVEPRLANPTEEDERGTDSALASSSRT